MSAIATGTVDPRLGRRCRRRDLPDRHDHQQAVAGRRLAAGVRRDAGGCSPSSAATPTPGCSATGWCSAAAGRRSCQYWRSVEQLYAYASDPTLPAPPGLGRVQPARPPQPGRGRDLARDLPGRRGGDGLREHPEHGPGRRGRRRAGERSPRPGPGPARRRPADRGDDRPPRVAAVAGGRVFLLRHGRDRVVADRPAHRAHRRAAHRARAGAGDRRRRARPRGCAATDPPALVLSSPRRRARDTAELAGLRVDRVDERLAEWDYGGYEGRTTAEIRERGARLDGVDAPLPRRRDRGAGRRAGPTRCWPRPGRPSPAATWCWSGTGTSAGC